MRSVPGLTACARCIRLQTSDAAVSLLDERQVNLELNGEVIASAYIEKQPEIAAPSSVSAEPACSFDADYRIPELCGR